MNEVKRKYGLLEPDLDHILSILTENRKIQEVILFGSRAKGNNSPGSDIDIAIRGAGLKLDDIIEAKIAFDELSLPYTLDLVIYDQIKDSALVEHINRVGILLFNRR